MVAVPVNGTTRMRLRFHLLVAGLMAGLAPSIAHADGYPPVFDPKDGCERWLGWSKGNDPSTRIQMRLCPSGDKVTGQVQTASPNSGYSTRKLEGEWSKGGTKLDAHDTEIIEDRPNAGWMFCTVDAWSLTRSGDVLNGSYSSAACQDQATVQLKKLPDPPKPEDAKAPEEVRGVDTTRPRSPAPPANRNRSRSRSARDGGGCGCQTHKSASPWWAALFVLTCFRRRAQEFRPRTRGPAGPQRRPSRRGDRRALVRQRVDGSQPDPLDPHAPNPRRVGVDDDDSNLRRTRRRLPAEV